LGTCYLVFHVANDDLLRLSTVLAKLDVACATEQRVAAFGVHVHVNRCML